jgi:hypothetical protein
VRGGSPESGRFQGKMDTRPYYAFESMRLVKNRAMMAPMMAF